VNVEVKREGAMEDDERKSARCDWRRLLKEIRNNE
jgi:hypothetical protein